MFNIRFTIFISLFIIFCGKIDAQDKYYTKTGHIYFISHTDIIDIDGNNNQVVSFLDIKTGEMVFAVLMKSFEFTLATAEEHFNENYVESDKYPKSKFSGKISNIGQIGLSVPGEYNVVVEGDLTIHGVTKYIKENGTLKVENEKIIAKSEFDIAIADYNIKVPKIVEDRVAEVVTIKVNMTYIPYISK